VVFAADQAGGILPSRYVMELNVVQQLAEEGDSLSNEYRDATDDETLNLSCAKELLDGEPTVDVEVMSAAGGELRHDLGRGSRHLFKNTALGRGQVYGTTAQHYNALVSIGPRPECKNDLEGFAAHHDRVDARDEFFVAVGYSAGLIEEVKLAVRPCDETIQAGADEDRDHDC